MFFSRRFKTFPGGPTFFPRKYFFLVGRAFNPYSFTDCYRFETITYKPDHKNKNLNKPLCLMTSLLFGVVIIYFRLWLSAFQNRGNFKTQLLLNERKHFSSVFEFGKIRLFNILPVLGSDDIWRHNYSLCIPKNAENLRKSSICHL